MPMRIRLTIALAAALVVDTVGHPHVEVFIFADEAGVGDALAGISRVIDRAL